MRLRIQVRCVCGGNTRVEEHDREHWSSSHSGYNLHLPILFVSISLVSNGGENCVAVAVP